MDMYRFWGCGGFTNEVLILEAKAKKRRGGGRVRKGAVLGAFPKRFPPLSLVAMIVTIVTVW